jgi:hypothetical protein
MNSKPGTEVIGPPALSNLMSPRPSIGSGSGALAILLHSFLVCAGAAAAWAGPLQSVPAEDVPLKAWKIDYSFSGGLAGLRRHMTVSDDGSVIVVSGNFHPDQARFSATSAEMAKILAALRQLSLSGPPRALPPTRPMPDAFMSSLEVTYGGLEYPIAKPAPPCCRRWDRS